MVLATDGGLGRGTTRDAEACACHAAPSRPLGSVN